VGRNQSKVGSEFQEQAGGSSDQVQGDGAAGAARQCEGKAAALSSEGQGGSSPRNYRTS